MAIVLTNNADSYAATTADEEIYALAGDDAVAAGAGADIVHGGLGNDRLYSFGSFHFGVHDTSYDQLYGDEGDDTLQGDLGQDYLNGGTGNDDMRGARGDDTYIVDSSADTSFDEAGYDIAYSTAAWWTMGAGIEELWLLGSGAINGYGNHGNNSIFGNGASNYLYGDEGDDVLDAGSGGDFLEGGLGADQLNGGFGDDTYYLTDPDTVLEFAGQGYDRVYAYSGNYTLTGNVEALTLAGFTNQNGTGNGLANFLKGNDANNVLNGLGGNDQIHGNFGDDTMLGGSGNDSLYGGPGKDTLRGQAGNDVLQGNAGAEILIGGADSDVFDFDKVTWSPPAERDIIRAGDGATAFQGVGVAGGDKIDLAGIDANTGTGANDAFILGGTGVRHLTLTDSGNNTIVRGNVNSTAAYELEIVIEDGAGVDASDYKAMDFML